MLLVATIGYVSTWITLVLQYQHSQTIPGTPMTEWLKKVASFAIGTSRSGICLSHAIVLEHMRVHTY
jgi:hypothetical protein